VCGVGASWSKGPGDSVVRVWAEHNVLKKFPKFDELGDVIHREVANRYVSDPSVVKQHVLHTLFLSFGGPTIDLGVTPLSHEEYQKEALQPLPMVTLVAALKSSRSVSSLGVSKSTQSLSGAIHSSQSHHRRRAPGIFSRSRIPCPLSFLGQQTFAQLTSHFPPLTEILHAHSIPLLILSKAFKVPLLSLIAVSR
jgi:hypothetical protein